MTPFFRWQFWQRRSRHWKKKCRDVEARYGLLLLQAEAEKWRNVAREDMFVGAAVMSSRNLFNIAPRTGPAPTQKPQSLLDIASQSGMPVMSGPDRMEFETEWLPYALQNGFTRQQAEAKFLQELAKRKPMNDEPMTM